MHLLLLRQTNVLRNILAPPAAKIFHFHVYSAHMCIECPYYDQGKTIFPEVFQCWQLPKSFIFTCFQCTYYLELAVLYTPTACPTDSDGLSSDPAISNGLSGQSVGSPSESVGHDWIPLLVRAKSSESPLKPLRSKKWLDWLEFCVRWTSAGLPLDFWWTEAETSHIC